MSFLYDLYAVAWWILILSDCGRQGSSISRQSAWLAVDIGGKHRVGVSNIVTDNTSSSSKWSNFLINNSPNGQREVLLLRKRSVERWSRNKVCKKCQGFDMIPTVYFILCRNLRIWSGFEPDTQWWLFTGIVRNAPVIKRIPALCTASTSNHSWSEPQLTLLSVLRHYAARLKICGFHVRYALKVKPRNFISVTHGMAWSYRWKFGLLCGFHRR